MISAFSRESMDQPRTVANHARGQLNRENVFFPVDPRSHLLRIGSRETSLPFRPASSAQSSSTPRINRVLTASPPTFPQQRRPASIPSTVASSSGHQSQVNNGIAQLRADDSVYPRESAGKRLIVLKIARVTDAAYSGNPMGQLLCAPLFSHQLFKEKSKHT